jgi:hypothetical protein
MGAEDDDYADPGLAPSAASSNDLGDLLTAVCSYGFLGLLVVAVAFFACAMFIL